MDLDRMKKPRIIGVHNASKQFFLFLFWNKNNVTTIIKSCKTFNHKPRFLFGRILRCRNHFISRHNITGSYHYEVSLRLKNM